MVTKSHGVLEEPICWLSPFTPFPLGSVRSGCLQQGSPSAWPYQILVWLSYKT